MKRAGQLLFLIIAVAGCRKPYDPPAIAHNGSYLVVEGVINTGSDSTIITLSKTVNVSSVITVNPVLQAIVTVENDQNAVFPLTETVNGKYVSAGLNLDNSHSYRLNIKTSDNKQYQSDLVPVNITPPIDSIGYNIINIPVTGIQIYANTHDPANAVKYYRWDYDEAWAFQAKYISYWVSNGATLVVRTQAQSITLCYTNDVSSDIVLGSSAKLQRDVLYQSPIAFIPSTSEKLESEYSILLHEYALTPDAYNFWVSLKKNTEQLGSIFDAQPSQLSGNIHCITNPSEPVIGYLSVCKVSSKRLNILNAHLPAWVATYPYACEQDTTGFDYDLLVLDSAHFITTGPPPPASGFPGKFEYTTRECADCTIRGNKIRPPFF